MFSFRKKLKKTKSDKNPQQDSYGKLSKKLSQNMNVMSEIFPRDSDFVIREFEVSVSGGLSAAIFFIDGLAGAGSVNEFVLRPLMIDSRHFPGLSEQKFQSLTQLCDEILISGEIEGGTHFAGAVEAILTGDTVLIVDGFSEYVAINTKGFEKRSVTEPQTETVVRGPREGFTEVLRVNTSLIRRKLKTEHLRMETMKLGEKSGTSVCIAYIDNIANPKLIREVKRRLETISTDAVLSSGYIEELIDDSPKSLFPTLGFTEKPDIVAAKLLEGRCAIIIDGAPFALTAPLLFVENFQTPEDYSTRPHIASFLRILRTIAFVISLTAPAFYIALTSFHQELIPTTLLFTIASSSEGTPFNSVFETAIMLLIFEILKESGIRLPRPVGQTVSIVGALVMGQAAIQSGLVGAPVVIVIAFTAVANYLVPNISDVTALLRWYLLLLSALMGGFGIVIGLMTILIHLASLESFGSIYLFPLSPFEPEGVKDSIVRAPMWYLHQRPKAFKPLDSVRAHTAEPKFGQDGDDL